MAKKESDIEIPNNELGTTELATGPGGSSATTNMGDAVTPVSGVTDPALLTSNAEIISTGSPFSGAYVARLLQVQGLPWASIKELAEEFKVKREGDQPWAELAQEIVVAEFKSKDISPYKAGRSPAEVAKAMNLRRGGVAEAGKVAFPSWRGRAETGSNGDKLRVDVLTGELINA